MLVSSPWLSFQSFSNLYPLHVIDQSPLINFLLKGAIYDKNIKYKHFNKLINSHEKINDKLPIAARYGYLDIVKYLVENGADIHYNSDASL